MPMFQNVTSALQHGGSKFLPLSNEEYSCDLSTAETNKTQYNSHENMVDWGQRQDYKIDVYDCWYDNNLGSTINHCVLVWSSPLFCDRNTLATDYRTEEILRDDLKYYFMSPCEKYRARHQKPWKLCVQILKIIMITTQVN